MVASLRGGCQCGLVRYRVAANSANSYACHCLECQKQSASAFALCVPVRWAALSVSGSTAVYERPTDSGTVTECHYCPSCGVRVFHRSVRSEDMVTLKAGTLDNAADLVPVAHLWTSRKHPWLQIPDDVPAYDTQPSDLRAWREQLLDGCAAR